MSRGDVSRVYGPDIGAFGFGWKPLLPPVWMLNSEGLLARRANKRIRFHEQHPLCCFCGGGTASEEIDHLPSRACFDNRDYPDGFEFPSCRNCNISTKDDEQVVALFSRMLANPAAPAVPNEIRRYVAGVANNNADVIAEIGRAITRLGENHHVLEIGDAAHQAFTNVLTRWSKAFHYRETGVIVPADGRIHVQYFTNANARYIPPEALEGRLHRLRRNGRNIGDQFAYVTRNDPNRPDLGYYTAAFRRSFLAIMLVDFHGEVIGQQQAD